jgi:hypothetical protein
VPVDDATRLAYVEMLADEQKPTVIGFSQALPGSTTRASSTDG